MVLFQIFLKSFLIAVKSLLSNPYLLILFLVFILFKIFYSEIRGIMGEFWVKMELDKLSEKKYIVLNDIMIESGGSTHQIDHLIISKYGIFIIEMKNYYGMIIGEEYKTNWTQYLGKNKYNFKNPIHQNYGHVKAIEDILKIDSKKIIPIVCFSNQVKLKVKTNSSVVKLDNLVQLIKKFTLIQLQEDNTDIVEKILKNNIIDKKRRKNHVKMIKEKIKNNIDKANEMVCPKCGSDLVERNGKYGTFKGCSNYPKCKYTKN